MFFAVSDYFATGEGRTVSIMLGPIQPRNDEWARAPGLVPGEGGVLHYDRGELAAPPETVVKRMFVDAFGEWYGHGCEILELAAFLERTRPFLPDVLIRILESDDLPALSYRAQLHFNYS